MDVKIKYLQGEGKGTWDVIDLKRLTNTPENGVLRHPTFNSDGCDFSTSVCEISWNGPVATLKYGGEFAKANRDAGIIIGDLRFDPSKITEQRTLLWRAEGDERFEESAIEVTALRAREGFRSSAVRTILSRDSALARMKLAVAIARGERRCAACKSEGHTAYGDSNSWLEVHHDHALHKGPRMSVMEELVLLCRNCHAVLHASGHEKINKFRARFDE
jgi:hypothetical protein